MKLLTGKVLFALLFVVVFGILIWTAMGYNSLSRMFPLIVGIPVFLGAIGNLVVDVRATLRGDKSAKATGSAAAEEAREKVVAAAPVLEMATAGGAGVPTSTGLAELPPHQTNAAPTPVVKPGKKEKGKLSGAEKRRRELVGIAWLIGYVVAIALIGFPLASIGYMVAFMKLYSRESWKMTIVYTAVLWAFIWIAFVFFLKSNLYWGKLFDLILG